MIFCSDPHIRSSIPRCRIDDFALAQDNKLNFICQEAVKSPPLVIPGDLLHLPKSNQWIEQYLIRTFKQYNIPIIITLGQHDLPGHSLQQINDGSIGVLQAAGIIHILTKESGPWIDANDGWIIWGCAYGEEPDKTMVDNQRKNILIWHKMVIKGDPLWPGQQADQAEKILRINDKYQIIVTGDNHQTHVTEVLGRKLINPGSVTRQSAIQINHHPVIFKLDNDKIEKIQIPHEDNVLDLAELESAKDKDERISAFVESLDKQWETGLSFEKNLEQFMEKNKTEPEVKAMVWGCLG